MGFLDLELEFRLRPNPRFLLVKCNMEGNGPRAMGREMCYKCNRPSQLCWCDAVVPMHTLTKFIFLMHPYEHRHIKLNTGRLTQMCLANSELFVGDTFDGHKEVRQIIEDPNNYPVLLYPGEGALDLSKGELGASELGGRRLVVFLLDATWRLARPMLRFSECLQTLPKVMFSDASPSRYVIKKQPEPGCLSTLEATHELLLALQKSGLDNYSMPDQLLSHFTKMQDFQVKCTEANRNPDFIPRRLRRKEGILSDDGKTNPSKRRRIFPTSE